MEERARCKVNGTKKLVVDAEGKLIIPAHVLAKRGLRPGDELTLVEAAEGLLAYQRGVDPLTARWWSSLSEDERRQARAEAQHYESLNEAERRRIWGERTYQSRRVWEVRRVDSPPSQTS